MTGDELVIGVNGRQLAEPEPTGIGRYTECLLEALATVSNARYVVFGVKTLPPALSDEPTITPAGAVPPTHSGPTAHLWEQTCLPLAVERYGVDLLHVPGGNPPLVSSSPVVTTIHDLAPVTHPEWFSRGYATLYRMTIPLAVRRSDRLLAVSAFTRDELLARYPVASNSVTVTYNGVSPPTGNDSIPNSGLDLDGYFLFVGADNPRKNLATLLAAYRRYRETVERPAELVLVGPQRDIFRGSGATGRGVHRLGYVTDTELGWLYRNATLLVFPSLYEGFGLPILEAMSAGIPVLTSDRGAMAEVAGEAAVLVDPTAPAAIADAMSRIAHDGTLRDRLADAGRDRAASFTWERAAEHTFEVYNEVVEGT